MLKKIDRIFKFRLIKPSFIIIGVQKGGTTALHNFLNEHSELCSPQIKELDFFSSDKYYRKGFSYYHNNFYFPKNMNAKMSFEASPSYLGNPFSPYPNVPERIYQYNPQIKLICLLRNPIDRAFSAWNMYARRYLENMDFYYDWAIPRWNYNENQINRREASEYNDFNLACKREIDFYNEGERLIEAPFVQAGLYFEHIKRYLTYFPNNQMLFLENVELLLDTNAALKKVSSFLEIDYTNFSINDGTKIFEGKYNNTVDKSTRTLLSRFYKESNEKLFDLIGKKYEWD